MIVWGWKLSRNAAAIATPSHAEFTPNRPHSSYAIAFEFSLCPGLGALAGPVARKFLFFRAEPTMDRSSGDSGN